MTEYGTREWSKYSVNYCYGCKHNCTYCYAKRIALRFGRIKSDEEWAIPIINQQNVDKNYKKRDGIIMIPTSHDIFEENLEATEIVLSKLLNAGNQLLIVSKPSFGLWKYKLLPFLELYKSQIELRFSITTDLDEVRKKYEPGAPKLNERITTLLRAYDYGFKVSVSCEPFLSNPIPLVSWIKRVCPLVDVWVGPMSGVVPPELKTLYTRERLLEYLPELQKMGVILKDGYRKKIGDENE